MISSIVVAVLAVVFVGPKALGNIVGGSRDYSDGFSVGYKKQAAKYKEEQYKK